MVKNIKGGKHKHIKKGPRPNDNGVLLLASDNPGSVYGLITKRFGTVFEVQCANEDVVRASIRGKFRKKVWIAIGDIVLVDGSQLDKYYIIHKYTPDQARQLQVRREINFDVTETVNDGIEFDENNADNSDAYLTKPDSTTDDYDTESGSDMDSNPEMVNQNRLEQKFQNKNRGAKTAVREIGRNMQRDKKTRATLKV